MKKLWVKLLLLGAALSIGVGIRQYVADQVDLFAVKSGSMGEFAPIGSLVATRAPSEGEVVLGDVITFELATGEVLTHRVVGFEGRSYLTQGDANEWRDPWPVAPELVRGVVKAVYPAAGRALVYLTLPVGMASVFSAMLTIVLAWRLFFPSEDERRRDLAPACVS